MNKSHVGYIANIESATLDNTDYRRVLFTGNKMQLVLMSLKPGEKIGVEVHKTHDQFIRLEKGQARVTLNEEITILMSDDVVIIPAGVKHNVENISDEELKLYTIYAPPEHEEGTVQVEKPKD